MLINKQRTDRCCGIRKIFTPQRDVRAIHPDIDAKQKWLENRWSDWRPVAGFLRAFHEEQVDVASGKVLQTTEVTRIEVNPSGIEEILRARR